MKLLSVNFHYIRDAVYPNGIYPRSLAQLDQQIDTLGRYYQFISQDELIQKIQDPNTARDDRAYCLITFDDGLKEQMDAFSLLNKKGVPALFYVTTHSIKYAKVVDVHKLHYIRSIMHDKEIFDFIYQQIDQTTITYPDNIETLYRYDPPETKRLKYLLNFILTPEVKEKLIHTLFTSLTEEHTFSKQLYMNKEDIQKIDSMGYLGTHSDRHLPLATLSEEEIHRDIADSLDFLENECACQKIRSISYPYGGPKAVSQKVSDIAGRFGFDFGLTMFRGMNDYHDLSTPLMLKRVDTNDAPGGKLESKEFCL